MITINNQPMLSLVISNIRRFGFKKFIFSTYYKGNLIKNYFKNGSSFDLNIDYTNEKKTIGTAGSLSLLRNKIKNEKNLLVTNCDIMSQINYKSLLDFHNENKADLTIAIKKFTSESQFGEMDLKGIRVRNIIEKPVKDIVINAAIYVIKTKLIREIQTNKHLDMDQFIRILIKNKKSNCFSFL